MFAAYFDEHIALQETGTTAQGKRFGMWTKSAFVQVSQPGDNCSVWHYLLACAGRVRKTTTGPSNLVRIRGSPTEGPPTPFSSIARRTTNKSPSGLSWGQKLLELIFHDYEGDGVWHAIGV